MDRVHIPEFLRFCIVGSIAFLVDVGLLETLVTIGFLAYVARIASIAVALQVSYALHGLFTYQNHKGFSRTSWATFMASNLIGASVNYVAFILVLHAALGNCPENSRLIALVAGTAIALGFNYWANRRYAFGRKEP
ncbi:MAG: GtrA family protein [Rickettsiales bacterium]